VFTVLYYSIPHPARRLKGEPAAKYETQEKGRTHDLHSQTEKQTGLRLFYFDGHVHIGRTSRGDPVKITAARDLTFANIARECVDRKGIDLVGIIDCGSPAVIQDIQEMVDHGEMIEQPGGGLRFRDSVTVILGSEVETGERNGGTSHHVSYFGTLEQLREFSRHLEGLMTNADLSSQRCRLTAKELCALTLSLGGVFMPAHCFTPHKSVYGNCAARMQALFEDMFPHIPAIELGLSADAYLADRLAELHDKSLLANSDAHSLPKIAREYNVLRMASPTFAELVMALRRERGRAVVETYGMDPRLGKYHRTYCLDCDQIVQASPPVAVCPVCHGTRVVKGVLDRIVEIQDYDHPHPPPHRGAYHYQVPLQFVPNVGPVTLNRLLNRFGTEMNVLHHAAPEELAAVVGRQIAANIVLARTGKLRLQTGGGGKYGRAITSEKQTQMKLFGEGSTQVREEL